MFRIVCAAIALLLTAPLAAEEAADHYHWRPVDESGQPRPWTILLPGASGLEIMGDGGHYFRFADWLNSLGVDALVVDYRKATKLLPDTQKGKPGPRIAMITRYAVEHERKLGRMDLRCGGAVIGWSLGGEGMWELAAGGRTGLPGLSQAIGIYPSVLGQKKGYDPKVAVTVLQGDEDSVTKPKALNAFVSNSLRPALIDVNMLVGARHGFDVSSLTQPAMGGKLLYKPEAEAAAKALLEPIVTSQSLGCALD